MGSTCAGGVIAGGRGLLISFDFQRDGTGATWAAAGRVPTTPVMRLATIRIDADFMGIVAQGWRRADCPLYHDQRRLSATRNPCLMAKCLQFTAQRCPIRSVFCHDQCLFRGQRLLHVVIRQRRAHRRP